ncbi:phosphatidate cytidylyltransferase [Hydrotalea sp.]|uniref:phosphatidate cytidylyltransferase n=1 Tax=Hydrotalea sp. TaxID=2881279 RepID=UPI003D104387
MALNLQTFKTRTGTAILFVIIMLAGLLINNWSFFVLFSIIHFGCWHEYRQLINKIYPPYVGRGLVHEYGVMVLGWCFVLWRFHNPYPIGEVTLYGLGWYLFLLLAVFLMAKEIVFKKDIDLKMVGYSVLGLLYISLSWGLMMNLRFDYWPVLNTLTISTEPGLVVVLLLIATIWINDTMAYLVGSFIGKTPLSAISPKKTWEGTLGGAIIAIVLAALLAVKITGMTLFIAFGITIIAAVMGTLGDLWESKLKRMAGVKDSGQIMPGHGGFLDRFDSLLLATPFVWLFLWIMSGMPLKLTITSIVCR